MTDYTDLLEWLDSKGKLSDYNCYKEASEAIRQLIAERDHWKNNHATEVRRAQILKERPDLPIERVQAYEKWKKDQDERDHYKEECLEQARLLGISSERELKLTAERDAAFAMSRCKES